LFRCKNSPYKLSRLNAYSNSLTCEKNWFEYLSMQGPNFWYPSKSEALKKKEEKNMRFNGLAWPEWPGFYQFWCTVRSRVSYHQNRKCLIHLCSWSDENILKDLLWKHCIHTVAHFISKSELCIAWVAVVYIVHADLISAGLPCSSCKWLVLDYFWNREKKTWNPDQPKDRYFIQKYIPVNNF
jgi:hypothetical protein